MQYFKLMVHNQFYRYKKKKTKQQKSIMTLPSLWVLTDVALKICSNKLQGLSGDRDSVTVAEGSGCQSVALSKVLVPVTVAEIQAGDQAVSGIIQ